MSFDTGHLEKKAWVIEGGRGELPTTVFMVVDYEEGESELSGALVTNALRVLSADMGALGEELASDKFHFDKPRIDKQPFFGSAVVLATCEVRGLTEPPVGFGYEERYI